jgi:hypothetical protein
MWQNSHGVIVGQLIGDGLRIELTNDGQAAEIVSKAEVQSAYDASSSRDVACTHQRYDVLMRPRSRTQANFTVCMYVRSDIVLDDSFSEYDLAYRYDPPSLRSLVLEVKRMRRVLT